jgi:hypothetical protein
MRFRNFTGWAALSLTLTAPAVADPAVPAIWYRASEACPNGPQFLDKLAENSRRGARLAQAGDHIDFVVTLVADPQETVGRLERQTDSGIVAIRELRDATCGQVADALALSLGLAMTPGSSNGAPPTASPAETVGNGAGATGNSKPTETVAARTPNSVAPSNLTTAAVSIPATDETPSPTAQPEHAPEWSVGAALGAMIGITTHPLPRAELFVDVKPSFSHFLPNLSERGGIVGATGSSETAIGPVQRWVLAGRFEGCPIAWVEGRFDLRPCAAFEIGVDNASGTSESSLDDHAIWAAPAGQLRAALALLPKVLALEVSGGALIPLIRKEIFAGSQSLYRDAPVVFHGSVGASVRLP